MEKTVYKYREAKFFLSKLKGINQETDEFNFYVSAFVSSARSIFWIMRNEFKAVEGWEEWFRSKKWGKRENEVLDMITSLRNTSLKATPIRTQYMGTFTLDEEMTLDEVNKIFESWQGSQIIITDEEIQSPRVSISVALDKVYRSHMICIGEDIVAVCEEYLGILSKITWECCKLFGNTAFLVNYLKDNPDKCKVITGVNKFSELCPKCQKYHIDEVTSMMNKLKQR